MKHAWFLSWKDYKQHYNELYAKNINLRKILFHWLSQMLHSHPEGIINTKKKLYVKKNFSKNSNPLINLLC